MGVQHGAALVTTAAVRVDSFFLHVDRKKAVWKQEEGHVRARGGGGGEGVQEGGVSLR